MKLPDFIAAFFTGVASAVATDNFIEAIIFMVCFHVVYECLLWRMK
jgi:hypothetical protein